MPTILASEAGAVLDSDIHDGGGTDDTEVLQAILDRAADGRPLHLVIDGVARVRGLDLHSNTVIEGRPGSGLFLADGSDRAILRNANRSRGAISDERIAIRGLVLNGNRRHQNTVAMPSGPPFELLNRASDGAFISGLEFLGINHLHLADLALWNVLSFGVWIGNGKSITIRDLEVDCKNDGKPASDDHVHTDGLHFNGPVRHVIVDGLRLRTGDDAIALNANDYIFDDLTKDDSLGPFVGQGPITDVLINNVQLEDVAQGVRVLSMRERVDRIVISNVVGTITGAAYVLNISSNTNQNLGNCGSIAISNVNVWRRPQTPEDIVRFREWLSLDRLEGPDLVQARRYDREFNSGKVGLCSVNAHVEALKLQNVATAATDERPILWVGPDARIGTMSVDMTLTGQVAGTQPMEVAPGAIVDDLDVTLHWNGPSDALAQSFRGMSSVESFRFNGVTH